MLNLLVLALLMLPLRMLGASASQTLPQNYGHLNRHDIIRFENDTKISYSSYGESCAIKKSTQTYKHKDLNGTKRCDHSYCARRFAALEQRFEGK